MNPAPSFTDADHNRRRFVWFRVLFNSRFYYPILAVLFLDLGLSAGQYTLLNFAWALAIVGLEVPFGALADRLGRRPLVVTAAGCLVVEMTLLCVAPINGGLTLFLICLANRLLSGAAEALASGADEALVYDSLAAENRQGEWPAVLDQVVRWQSAAMVVAMLVGAAVYDPALMGRAAGALGFGPLTQGTTLRFPLLLNLVTGALALVIALGLREPPSTAAPEKGAPVGGAFRETLAAGAWILRTPAALFVILAGLAVDSVVRLFLTFSSTYLRLIEWPAASFGLIGAGLAGLGLAVAPAARRLVARGSLAGNFAILATVAMVGLVGVALRWPHWGVLFTVPLGAAMTMVSFFTSHYLNALTDSRRRATVLSFKGLAFNLGYGFVSLLFALALRAGRGGGGSGGGDASEEVTFGAALRYLPWWLAVAAGLLGALFWRHRAGLREKAG